MSGFRFSTYEERLKQTPTLDSGRWIGSRGESMCIPQSEKAKTILKEKNMSGIMYHNGEPDFSPVSECTVKLGYMNSERDSKGVLYGRDSSSTLYAKFDSRGKTVSESSRADPNSMSDIHMKYAFPGNFDQSDILAAQQWTVEKKDQKEWTANDVSQYRKHHGLTWHECNDGETMMLIPSAINSDFGHLGGVGEMKRKQSIINEVSEWFENEYDDDYGMKDSVQGGDDMATALEEIKSFHSNVGSALAQSETSVQSLTSQITQCKQLRDHAYRQADNKERQAREKQQQAQREYSIVVQLQNEYNSLASQARSAEDENERQKIENQIQHNRAIAEAHSSRQIALEQEARNLEMETQQFRQQAHQYSQAMSQLKSQLKEVRSKCRRMGEACRRYGSIANRCASSFNQQSNAFQNVAGYRFGSSASQAASNRSSAASEASQIGSSLMAIGQQFSRLASSGDDDDMDGR